MFISDVYTTCTCFDTCITGKEFKLECPSGDELPQKVFLFFTLTLSSHLYLFYEHCRGLIQARTHIRPHQVTPVKQVSMQIHQGTYIEFRSWIVLERCTDSIGYMALEYNNNNIIRSVLFVSVYVHMFHYVVQDCSFLTHSTVGMAKTMLTFPF